MVIRIMGVSDPAAFQIAQKIDVIDVPIGIQVAPAYRERKPMNEAQGMVCRARHLVVLHEKREPPSYAPGHGAGA